MSTPTLRSRYLSSSVSTSSPGQLLSMLWDRLVLDVTVAVDALDAHDRTTASQRLLHAQEILLHLRGALDLTIWPQGARLADVYVWCWQELVTANLEQDVRKVRDVIPIVTRLRDAWQEAAAISGSTPMEGVEGRA